MSLPRAFLEQRYELLDTLSDDGVEAVIRARHRQLGELCVVRVRPQRLDEDEALAARFETRLAWVTRLRHPHLVQPFDLLLAEPGFAVLETASIDADGLDEMIAESLRRGESLAPRTAVALFDGGLDVVGWLHDQGWSHGDLTADRFVVPRQGRGGNPARLLLVEPGLARLVGAPERTTAGGLLMRRLRYAAPESFTGSGAVAGPDVAGDVYALGLVLYELLTGRFPIEGDNPTSIAAGHMLRPPLSFERSDPEERVGGSLRAVVSRCLAKRPEDRFESTGALREALRIAQPDAYAGDGVDPEAVDPEALDPEAIDRLRPSSRAESTAPVAPPASEEEARTSRRQRVADLVDRASRAVGAGDFQAATDLLRRGLELEPEEGKLRALLEQVEAAGRARRRDLRRAQELDALADAVEARLAADDLERARALLSEAGDAVPQHPRLSPLRDRIEALVADSTAVTGGDHDRQADALVSKARRLSQQEDFDGAYEVLAQARHLAPEHAEARTLSESVEALRALRRTETHRIEDRERSFEEIRAMLRRERPRDAMALLQKAISRYGEIAELQALRDHIAKAVLAAEIGAPLPPFEETPRRASRAPGPAGPAGPAGPPTGPPLSAPPAAPAQSPHEPAHGLILTPPPAAPLVAGPEPPPAADLAFDPPLQPGVPTAEPDGPRPPALAPSISAAETAPPPALRPLPATSSPAGAADAGTARVASSGFDFRRPITWVVVVALVVLFAFLGRWLAGLSREQPVDERPRVETEDVIDPRLWSDLPRQPSQSSRSASMRATASSTLSAGSPSRASARTSTSARSAVRSGSWSIVTTSRSQPARSASTAPGKSAVRSTVGATTTPSKLRS